MNAHTSLLARMTAELEDAFAANAEAAREILMHYEAARLEAYSHSEVVDMLLGGYYPALPTCAAQCASWVCALYSEDMLKDILASAPAMDSLLYAFYEQPFPTTRA
jgi:hypothetical protein